ncbi:dystroglycan 1-like [Tachypleus tridentatus]|uniref:dystroglycan 1-like n=1 Tax=Tachypleus tridentatus TaxID=6853 RepID=UPI003FD10681
MMMNKSVCWESSFYFPMTKVPNRLIIQYTWMLVLCLSATSACSMQTVRDDVKRFWGVPDTTATVGKVFNYTIPDDAFSGNISHVEVTEAGEQTLPSWLYFDKYNGTFQGVPSEDDLGQYYISVKAIGPCSVQGTLSTDQDVFSIEVIEEHPSITPAVPLPDLTTESLHCLPGVPVTITSLMLDANLEDISPTSRVILLSKMATFLELPTDLLKLTSLGTDQKIPETSAVLAGAGTLKRRQEMGIMLQWQVGCSGEIHNDHNNRISKLERVVEDGVLATLLGFPLIGWQVVANQPKMTRREKRQVAIQGTPLLEPTQPTKWQILPKYVEEELTVETELPQSRIIPTMISPTYNSPSHHHRHHHGEQLRHKEIVIPPTIHYHMASIAWPSSPFPTPVYQPDIPTIYVPPSFIDSSEPSRNLPEELTPVDHLLSSLTQATMISKPTEALPIPSRTFVITSSVVAFDIKPTTTQISETSKIKVNHKPTIEKRVKKLSMVAGSIWSYHIPADTFLDVEDGNTRYLKLIFMTGERTAIPSSSWIQFDPANQTLYALPLKDNIGKYEFILEAMDSEGMTTHDRLEIHVRQHPSARAIHHEFSMTLKYQKWQYRLAIDWQIEVVQRLAKLYGDTHTRNVNVQTISLEPVTLTWTNFTLPKYPCPRENITELMNKLIADDEGHPTKVLRKEMGDDFHVKKVTVNFLGVCHHPISSTPTHTNFEPMLRNPIEQINGTVGEILRFRVPDDTFYDFEDGSTRYLKLTFLTIDNINPPKSLWVQFDAKSQELYGLPFDNDVGRHEFQMVAMDEHGKEVNDAFVIVIHQRPPRKRSVEFSLHIDYDFENFDHDTGKKVLVAWKLARLFGDSDPRYITVTSISKGSVVYAWTNNTLPHNPCPKTTISNLVKYLFNENGTISSRLITAMNPEFRIIKADAMPLGICLGAVTPTSVTVTPTPEVKEAEATGTSNDDIYITTIIPAVVIAVMLVIAALVACFLYRKKRKGKMTMQDNSTFISKGIPIIFADELEEKPDPAKPPVIMKNERPPLAPPDYPRSSRGSSRDTTPQTERKETANHNVDMHSDTISSPPYQPPPPFTTNRDNKNFRPKTTPTFRQPPPYVPP